MLILSIFIFSFISADVPYKQCTLTARADCLEANNDSIVMGTTDLTNAHGQNATDGTYDSVLCCDAGEGSIDCKSTPSNKIVKLSSETNAHAEGPTGVNYPASVCYEDFNCELQTDICAKIGNKDSKAVLSISNITNAHIGKPEDYAYKICCTSSMLRECNISNVEWDIDEDKVVEGEIAPIYVEGSGEECRGKNVSFEVTETTGAYTVKKQPAIATFDASGIIDINTKGWTSEYKGIGLFGVTAPKYTVRATLVETPTVTRESTDELSVSPLGDDFCLAIQTCEDYILENQCNTDSPCSVSEYQGGTLDLDCSVDGTCGCGWSETNGCGFVTRDLENTSAGYCSWTYNVIEDRCQDSGMRIIQKNGTWVGIIPDPETTTYTTCKTSYEQEVVSCPALTKLPFFDEYTLIIAVVLIAGIYFLIIKKKKLGKKASKKQTKKSKRVKKK